MDPRPGWFWGLAALLILTTAMILPLQPLLAGHLPWQGDGLIHFYRLGALAEAIDWGWVYPRWLPDLAQGAGFPLFNYYAPLSYYAVLPLYLAGLTAGLAMRLSYIVAVLLLGAGGWGWGRENGWGHWGLLVVTAPYTAYNLYQRAALAELWGLAALTMTLWLVQRAASHPNRRRLVTAALAFAALMVAHNITALIGTPFIIGLALFIGWTSRPSGRWGLRLGWLPLGLSLSAFFWVPAIFESHLVQINRLTGSSNFNYVNHFLAISDWLSWPPPADPALINPPLPLAAGWGQLLLAIMGVGLLFSGGRTRGDLDRRPMLLALAFLISLLMTHALSSPLWAAVPGVAFVQFPWRFLGPAAIFAALLNGYVLQTWWKSRRWWARGLVLGLIILMILQQLPYLFPLSQPTVPARITAEDLAIFERESGWLGTTSAADYLPIGVTDLPVERLIRPPFNGRTLTLVVDSGTSRQIIPQFAFPGWQVEIDGRPVDYAVVPGTGLIWIEPPEDGRSLLLTYRGTALQGAMGWLSLLTLGGTLATIFILSIGSLRCRISMTVDQPTVAAAAAAALAALLVKTAVLDQVNHPLRQTRFNGSIIEGVPAADVIFDNRLQLIGVGLTDGSQPADAPLAVDLYWRGLAFDQELSVAVHLLDEHGLRLAQSDSFHPADFPLTRWRPGQYARDSHTLRLPVGSLPGEYRLRLLVYDQQGIQKELLDPSGQPLGVAYDLGRVEFTPAGRPPTRADVSPQIPLDLPINPDITILGIDQGLAQAEAGQTIFMSIYWETVSPPTTLLTGTLTLVDTTNGITWGSSSLAPHSPEPGWRAGEVRIARYPLRIPAAAPTGQYEIRLNDQRLDDLAITAPDRLYSEPTIDVRLDEPVGAAAFLRGYTAACPLNEPTCHIQLIWETQGPQDISYTVFVQLLSPDGRPVAQSDRTPHNQGQPRPASSWLPGEFLIDKHTLFLPASLPPGPYRLITGLYDPTSGKRLPTAEGDAITILIIEE